MVTSRIVGNKCHNDSFTGLVWVLPDYTRYYEPSVSLSLTASVFPNVRGDCLFKTSQKIAPTATEKEKGSEMLFV